MPLPATQPVSCDLDELGRLYQDDLSPPLDDVCTRSEPRPFRELERGTHESSGTSPRRTGVDAVSHDEQHVAGIRDAAGYNISEHRRLRGVQLLHELAREVHEVPELLSIRDSLSRGDRTQEETGSFREEYVPADQRRLLLRISHVGFIHHSEMTHRAPNALYGHCDQVAVDVAFATNLTQHRGDSNDPGLHDA